MKKRVIITIIIIIVIILITIYVIYNEKVNGEIINNEVINNVIPTNPIVDNKKVSDEVVKLSFKDSNNNLSIAELSGRNVIITGYMSTLSPVDGRFVYLMNLPYQSCPFCKPSTTRLSNTVAAYAKLGSKFEFTDRPVTIEGKLFTGEYTDEFGYTYNFRLENATMKIADVDKLSENIKIYSAISKDGLLQTILSLILQTNTNIYYEEYKYSTSELKPVDIAKIDDCINKLNSISVVDYKEVVDNLKKLKDVNIIVNENLKNKIYNSRETQGQNINLIYNLTNAWVNKYEL